MKNKLTAWPVLVACLFLLLLQTACSEKRPPRIPPPPPELSPRGLYLEGLHFSGLGETELVEKWKEVAEKALLDSTEVSLPFQEIGYFDAQRPAAFAYRMSLRAGERLDISLQASAKNKLFFLELFKMELDSNRESAQPVFYAEPQSVDSIAYEAFEEGTYLLRLQGELLLSTRFRLQMSTQPVYGYFPVSGKSNQDIWSFFGDPRDGGRRKHKGVDIFARRGTPVVAAMDGTVRSVRNRGLGGKQVWLRDNARNQSLYYAHLDSQLVVEGMRVKAGDTLGWVGNTGNARNTAPHLHFSIYKRGQGAIDPHPFIARQKSRPARVQVDSAVIGQMMRTKGIASTLRSAPSHRSSALLSLSPHLPLQIHAATQSWLRVQTPSGHMGYLNQSKAESLDRPLQTLSLEKATEIWTGISDEAMPFAALPAASEVEVLGSHQENLWVRTAQGLAGWLSP